MVRHGDGLAEGGWIFESGGGRFERGFGTMGRQVDEIVEVGRRGEANNATPSYRISSLPFPFKARRR